MRPRVLQRRDLPVRARLTRSPQPARGRCGSMGRMDDERPAQVTLRGGYESRVALALVALVFLGLAISMTRSTGQAGLAGTLVFAIPVAAVSLGMLAVVLRSSVVVTHDDLLVRPFADPRTTRIPRSAIVGIDVVEVGSVAMSAVAPRLLVRREALEPEAPEHTELTPLAVWTWWRPGVPARTERLVRTLHDALGLPRDGDR